VREYAPSVMYDVRKVIYSGGGNSGPIDAPTAAAEIIDLSANPPAWREVSGMHFARRQHNATILADGAVLVTGGTRGPGFNDLSPVSPVHAAELWDPATEEWTQLAAEDIDRCYHSNGRTSPGCQQYPAQAAASSQSAAAQTILGTVTAMRRCSTRLTSSTAHVRKSSLLPRK
jgi:hypothetical protein